jgi:RNA polymerase sigma-70 factor (ECF subfamily)
MDGVEALPARTVAQATARSPAQSDDALVALVAAGDRNAMQALFLRHRVRVYRFIARMTKDAPAAADLTSEVFLEVWRQAGRFQGRSQVSTWLLAIARYKAVSALRRYVPEELDKEAAECIEDPADSPQAAIEGRQRSELIRRTLTQLSPAHREVIDLVYYHERSIDEVAAIVGIPQNTVKTRLFNARKRMADLLPADEFSQRRISDPHERCRFGAPINVSEDFGPTARTSAAAAPTNRRDDLHGRSSHPGGL